MNDRTVIPIHNSDQESFLQCRRKWDLTSILREAYRPFDMPTPLKFGICMHKAYQVLYQPETWNADRFTVYAMAVAEFVYSMEEVRAKFLKDTGQPGLNEEQQAEYIMLMTLGPKMLEVYHGYMERCEEQKFLKPLGVEEDWEVPLGFSKDGIEVVFRFRTDLRVEDEYGQQWLWDHKTTARMSESTDFLTRDPQQGKYLWGLLQLGLPVVGAIYNEQYKGYPCKPEVLKSRRLGRGLSTSKSSDTTYELMLEAIEEHGEDPAMYEEYLDWLKSSQNAKQWTRRTQIRRNNHELVQQGHALKEIAIDMLDDPRIYISPSKFKCDWCMVKAPCMQMLDGSDYQWTLDNMFEKVTNHYGRAV